MESSEAIEESKTKPGARFDLDATFIALYRATYPRLVRSLELGGTERTIAEDVAQEAFARTLDRWWRVRRGSNPAGYVYTIAFRLARRTSPVRAGPIGDVPTPDPGEALDIEIDVERVLSAMPLARRRCAVLCLVVGLSTRDAARSLGIAESTVRKQLERARSDLRVGLADLS